MRKVYVTIALAFTAFAMNAQVGIGTTTPDASSELDITSTNRGFLMPRVALTSTTDTATINGAEATSLLVYNTATAGDVTPGFYYWDGAQWVTLGGASAAAWELLGNAGTNSATNFLGTTDAQDLVIRTNNTEVLRVTQLDGSNDPKIIAGNGANKGDINDPLYTFSSDDNTGIWSDVADEMNLGAGSREFLTLSEGGTDELIVNDRGATSGHDINFRVESIGDANMLFVDAGNDRVGIGTNTPQTTLDLAGVGSVFRIEDLNSTNDPDNNGVDLAPLAVNANGDIVIGGQSFLSDVDVDLDQTSFLEPAISIASNDGTQQFVDLLGGTPVSFTLTQTTLVEINISVPCRLDNNAGGPITDNAVRWFGIIVLVNGGFENWFTENYTNGDAGFSGGGFTPTDIYTSGPFMLNGSVYVSLGPGTHTIDLTGTVAGARRVNGGGAIVDWVETNATFGGNGFGATLKVIYHN